MSLSRAPKHVWRKTPDEVKEVIGQMHFELSEQYLGKAGPKTILYELRKREDLKDAEHSVS